MKIALIVLAVLVGIPAILFLIGTTLSRTHRTSSRITVKQPPVDVWAVVRDLSALQGTWKELKSSHRLPDQNGKEVWEQNAGGWPLRLVVEEASPPHRLVSRIDTAPDAAFGGTWTYELVAAAGGTQLTITEDGYVGNPLFRVMMKAMGEHRTMDGYLRALGSKLGERVEPVHV